MKPLKRNCLVYSEIQLLQFIARHGRCRVRLSQVQNPNEEWALLQREVSSEAVEKETWECMTPSRPVGFCFVACWIKRRGLRPPEDPEKFFCPIPEGLMRRFFNPNFLTYYFDPVLQSLDVHITELGLRWAFSSVPRDEMSDPYQGFYTLFEDV